MENYITESPAAGLLCPIFSPAGAGLFVGKRARGLKPFIEYWGLNQIPVCNRYTLTFIAIVFELHQGTTVFTKLDLHNA